MAHWKLLAAVAVVVLLTGCAEVDTRRPGGGGSAGAYVPSDRQ